MGEREFFDSCVYVSVLIFGSRLRKSPIYPPRRIIFNFTQYCNISFMRLLCACVAARRQVLKRPLVSSLRDLYNSIAHIITNHGQSLVISWLTLAESRFHDRAFPIDTETYPRLWFPIRPLKELRAEWRYIDRDPQFQAFLNPHRRLFLPFSFTFLRFPPFLRTLILQR